MIRVKICGNTSPQDALAAALAGADAVGLIFFEKSPRAVSIETAQAICASLPPFVTSVGVFVNESAGRIWELRQEVGFDIVQLHGEESPELIDALPCPVIKAVRLSGPEALEGLDRYGGADAILLDTAGTGVYGGSGVRGDWELALAAAKRLAHASQPLILAGGLDAQNVAEAIGRVRPYGVDVVSGVEASPGRKDQGKVAAFIQSATRAAPKS